MTWGGQQIDGQYDGGARLTRIDRNNGTLTHFTYDGNDRLTSVDHRSGTIDVINIRPAYIVIGSLAMFAAAFWMRIINSAAGAIA